MFDLLATGERVWREPDFALTRDRQEPRDTPRGVPTIWQSKRGFCFPAEVDWHHFRV
jgi:hypothetical protein